MAFAHLDGVVTVVEPLARVFEQAGYRLYLVGGIVRDQWLDHALDSSSDIDMTTDAGPDVIKELVSDLADALWTQGERFGTIGLRYAGRSLEITTHRAESYTSESRKPVVSFGTDIAVDLSRRDFTVNAMAIEVPSGKLVDPWNGAADLAAGRLRTPLEPEVSFSDDPLRMLRAARFGAKYELGSTPELIAAATTLRGRLQIVAIERIGDELERLFGLNRVGAGVEFLVQTELALELLEWNGASLAAPMRERLPLAATLVDTVGDADWRTRLAAFLLATFDDVDLVADAAVRLRLSRDDQRQVIDIARGADAINARSAPAEAGTPPSTPDLRRWVSATEHRERAIDVATALAPDGPAAAFAAALAELAGGEGLDALTTLDGETVMDLLSVPAGPIVGEAMKVLRQALLEQGPLPAAAQISILESWWSDRSADA